MLQLNDIQKGKEYFHESLDLDPNFFESKIQLALIAIQEKNLEEAFSLASDVAEKTPNFLPAQRLTAAIAFELGKFQLVIEILEPLIEEMPSVQVKELVILTKSWIALNKPDMAKIFLMKFLEKNPGLKNQLEENEFLFQLINRHS